MSSRASLIVGGWLVAILLLGAAPQATFGDAAEDLESGRAALQAGDLDQALKLLTGAAQALPMSVEAQLALAHAHVRIGDFDDAVKQYRKVLRLSPDHVEAKRFVDAMAGRTATFDQRMAAARKLMQLGAYAQAQSPLSHLVQQAVEPAQRDAARLLMAEARLWSGDTANTLNDALRLIEESKDDDTVGSARVIAALAMVSWNDKVEIEDVRRLLGEAPNVPAAWKPRLQLAELLADLEKSDAAERIASAMAAPLESVPDSEYRGKLTQRLAEQLQSHADRFVQRGDTDKAMAIVKPMVGELPAEGEDGGQGGWAMRRADDHLLRVGVANILAAVSRRQHEQDPLNAALEGHRLAARVLSFDARRGRSDSVTRILHLAADLGPLSRPAQTGDTGDMPRRADVVQRDILIRAAAFEATAKDRQTLVQQIEDQIERYRKADQLESGLKAFTVAGNMDPAAGPVDVRPIAGLGRPPSDPADQRLLVKLAGGYAELGGKAFARAADPLNRNATIALNPHDAAALHLYSQITRLHPDAPADASARAIIERYAAAEQWAAAATAIKVYHADGTDNTSTWALVHLKLRQVAAGENRRLMADRKLGDTLAAATVEALQLAAGTMKSNDTQSNRNAVIAVADSQVERYLTHERPDLATAVVDTVAKANAAVEGAPLADWALWTRARIAGHQGDRTLAATGPAQPGGEAATVNEQHAAELKSLASCPSGNGIRTGLPSPIRQT